MILKERKRQLLQSWVDEQNDSWRDDEAESSQWRGALTQEERELVREWDRKAPLAEIEAL